MHISVDNHVHAKGEMQALNVMIIDATVMATMKGAWFIRKHIHWQSTVDCAPMLICAPVCMDLHCVASHLCA